MAVGSGLPIGGKGEEVVCGKDLVCSLFPSQNGLDSAAGFSKTVVEAGGIPKIFARVGAVPQVDDEALRFDTVDFSFKTCDVVKKFGTVVPFVDEEAADEANVETDFSELKSEVWGSTGGGSKIGIAGVGCVSFGLESFLGTSEGVDDFERENGRVLIGGSLAFWRSSTLGKGAGVCKRKNISKIQNEILANNSRPLRMKTQMGC